MKYKNIVKQVINDLIKAGIKSAGIDARILSEFVIGKSEEFLLTHPEFELSDREVAKLKNIVSARKSGKPIAYITNKKEFFGLDFYVDERVLIPRPESEILVEKVQEFITDYCSKPRDKDLSLRSNNIRILDIGTGSGNLIVSLAHSLKIVPHFIGIPPEAAKNCKLKIDFIASDTSADALSVAKKNAKKHNVKINFIQSDLFENIPKKYYDIILANLPYVPVSGSSDNEISFEPQNAIFADDNGSEIIKRFLTEAKKYLNENGKIFIELDPRNAKNLLKFAKKIYMKCDLEKDYSGKNRYLILNR